MLATILVLAAAVVPATANYTAAYTISKVNSFKLNSAATVRIVPGRMGTFFPGDNAALLMTTFNVFKGDGVWGVPNANALFNNTTKPEVNLLDNTIHWPNQASLVPAGAVRNSDRQSLILEAGGFFPNPTKSTGQIIISDVTTSTVSHVKISHDKSSWFYHHAIWEDMDGDGHLDVLAARAYVPTIPIHPQGGELIWLEQPDDPLNDPWPEHTLVSPAGPDVSFLMEDLDGDGKKEVIAGQSFGKQDLVLYSCPEATWGLCNTSNVQAQIIDSTLGRLFDMQLTDMNGDGKIDLLVTDNKADGHGSVFVFEIPKVLSGTWVKHTISTGYKPINTLAPGSGGPGVPVAFFPNLKMQKGKPDVMVSGDDNGTVVHLTPNSASPTDWTYQETRVCQGTGTIGTVAVGDINGDDYADIVVPLFKDSTVAVYSFMPTEH